MSDLRWSDSEKEVARRAFDAALARELAALMASTKKRALDAKAPDDLCALQDFLSAKRKEIDRKYDYRYSQLIFVLACLLRETWITVSELEGLKEEKLEEIRTLAVGLQE